MINMESLALALSIIEEIWCQIDKKKTLSVIRVFFLIFCSSQFNSICLSDETYRECALVAIIGGKDFRPPFDG